ncbi:UNVERIFIED_CONTAM: hypothetical protein GTU68_050497 [Idotea baltica]|nr:hypothetical protein [Idotea baltica]
MRNLVILSGAGVSAESGINTFRDAGGLWEGHDVMEVASPTGWHKNPGLVLDFYNQRRSQLKIVKPNLAHDIIAQLQDKYNVQVVTQNVDDLHERAGSKHVLHLHGELLKSRSVAREDLVYTCDDDINLGDMAEDGAQLRPHIVWFGEEVPLLAQAASKVQQADVLIIIGTSLLVYPAAGLHGYAPSTCKKYLVDLQPNLDMIDPEKIEVIQDSATQGMSYLNSLLRR